MSWVDRLLFRFSPQYRELFAAHTKQEEYVKGLKAKHEGRVLSLQLQAETEAEAFGDVRVRLEDEVREKEQLLSEMTKEAADARKETIETHRKYADYLAFNLNRRPVFEPYVGPVITEAPTPISSGRVHASDVVRELTAKAMERDTARRNAATELANQEAEARAKAKHARTGTDSGKAS